MRKAIDIYGDKEHITEVNAKYVFFKFPDGSQDHTKSRKNDLIEVYKWIGEEMQFYNRMYRETQRMYEEESERFKKNRHYYSEEEIKEACRGNRFANIPMEISNEKYKEDWYTICGKSDIASYAMNKYWKLYRLNAEIKAAIHEL